MADQSLISAAFPRICGKRSVIPFSDIQSFVVVSHTSRHHIMPISARRLMYVPGVMFGHSDCVFGSHSFGPRASRMCVGICHLSLRSAPFMVSLVPTPVICALSFISIHASIMLSVFS